MERRVCTLVNELGRLDVDIRLGLLREEGEFLNEVPRSRLVLAPPDARLKNLLHALLRSRDFVNGVLGVWQIRRMIEQIKPDVLVSFTLETTIPTFFAVPAHRAKPITWIISEDSNTARAAALTSRAALSVKMVQALLGKIYQKAHRISCVSNSVANSVREVYRVDRARLDCLPNPVDIARVRKAIRTPSNPAGGSDYILAVGRLVPVKQFDLSVRAFAEVRKHRRIKLVLLGVGPERERLSSLAEAHGVAHDVLFLGFVSNPWSIMACAKLLLLTSKLEGFGNVIVESMAAGCPVIATRCGGPEDIIRNRENGILVEQDMAEIANAVLLLLGDPELSESLVRNAGVDVENYAPERISMKFKAFLQQTLDPGF